MAYLIFFIILVICELAAFICPVLYKMPFKANFVPLPLVSLAFLGLHWILYHNKSEVHVFGVILWVFIALFSFISVTNSYIVLIGADGEKKSEPLVFKKPGNTKSIALVYHPGGSGFPKRLNSLLAGRLSEQGVNVTLYTANSGLKINTKEISALILSSPVYGGVLRPPLVNWAGTADLAGVKCFVVLTGWFNDFSPEMRAQMTENVKRMVEARGGKFAGYGKFSSFSGKLKEETEAFAVSVKDKL